MGKVSIRRGAAEVSLTPSTEVDFSYINANLRELDKFEQSHFIKTGWTDKEDSLETMEQAWTLRIGGDIVGYVGLQVPPMASRMSPSRIMPMLSTKNVGNHWVDYVRLSRPVLHWVMRQAPGWVEDFYSMPFKRYDASVRWHEKTMGWHRVGESKAADEKLVVFHVCRKEI